MRRHENILEEVKILVDRTGRHPMKHRYHTDEPYDIVENIGWLRSEGWTYAMIGKVYGVSKDTIRKELEGKR